MKFSIIVATHNRRNKLRLCLQSLLNQNYPQEQYEVIIADDGSTDGTRAMVKELASKTSNLTYLRVADNPKGPATARNFGLKKAKGEILAFTDSDCTVPQDWLSELEQGYQKYPQAAGVGGYLEAPKELLRSNCFARYEVHNEKKYFPQIDNRNSRPCAPDVTFGEYLSTKRDEHPFESNNISYRKAVLSEVGGFDESFPPFASGEDGDLKERVVNRGGKVLFIPTKVTHHQDYSLKSFWRRQQTRGAGILKFARDHQLRKQTKLEIALKAFLAPTALLRALARKTPPKIAVLHSLAFLARQVGKLKRYDQI